MELTEEQSNAVLSAINHILFFELLKKSGMSNEELKKHQFMVISGYAGTGKSVVIGAIRDILTGDLDGSITAFTGKACENLISKNIPCYTSHSMLYEPKLDENGDLLYFQKIPFTDLQLGTYLIVEEASMMNLDMLEDAFKTMTPVIFVGDDAQLPAIEGESIFMALENGDYEGVSISFLEKIHRTEDGSSINEFAYHVRTTGNFDFSKCGDDVSTIRKKDFNLKWLKENFDMDSAIVCALNQTRKKYNRLTRAALGYNSEIPEPGERIVCLKNNILDGVRINNGETYIVEQSYYGQTISQFMIRKQFSDGKLGNSLIRVSVDNNMWDDEVRLDGNLSNRKLCDFTYGYAMTCHKCQGSSFKNVFFYDEDVSFFLEQKRYRYTGITRAAKKLTVVR